MMLDGFTLIVDCSLMDLRVGLGLETPCSLGYQSVTSNTETVYYGSGSMHANSDSSELYKSVSVVFKHNIFIHWRGEHLDDVRVQPGDGRLGLEQTSQTEA